MKNKFLTIFLGIIVSLFFTNYCLALSVPYNLNVGVVGEASASLNWCWNEGGGVIKQFKLLWREGTELAEEDWEAKYPSSVGESGSGDCDSGGYLYNYSLRGLEAETSYEWRVRAEAESPSQDSSYEDGESFTTEESQWEEDPLEGNIENEVTLTIENIFDDIGNVGEAADAFTEFLVISGFAVGPILIIYAAFILLTKQGNPDAITQAKKIILWTIISLSIMLFAKGIPSVVKDLFK